MRYQLISVALITAVSGHGLVTSINGANGVNMPGLSVTDGTPRDCSSNGCGSQADTSIIRDREISSGKVGPLGRTEGNGPVNPAINIANFMGSGNNPPVNNGTGTGQEDNIPNNIGQGAQKHRRSMRRSAHRHNAVERRQLGSFLGNLFGGNDDNQGQKTEEPQEVSVAESSGEGAKSGLPTASDDGVVTLKYRQINQDGAGPLSAVIDATSGGSDATAFQNAEVTQDVPGIGFGGLSLATNTDFPVKVQMPQGMTCDGSVGGANNVCIVRVRNSAAAGPFGGSAAFTQSAAARKRAIEYRLKKRMQINRKN